MHVTHSEQIAVSPQGPQDERTQPFALIEGTRVNVRAEGHIGSGVFGTGPTPPTGWNEMLAGTGDTDWPYRGRDDSFRYSLIGKFLNLENGSAGDWFYIGSGRTIVGGGPLTGSGVQLRLAVNRPNVDDFAAGPHQGDGRWVVHVDIHAPDEAVSSGTQDGWRYCSRCQGLAFAGNGWLGRCSAGGEHNFSHSGRYTLAYESSGQGDWRWCHRCEGLFFHGNDSFGRCPAGGTHAPDALSRSSNYTLVQDGSGQDGWRWCGRCQGLYFRGHGFGICPADGSHIDAGSGNYVLQHVP